MTPRFLSHAAAAALTAASAIQPIPASAAEAMLQISASAAERRIVITTSAALPGSQAAWSGVLQDGAVVTRFSIEPLEASATPAADWWVELTGTLGGVAVRFARFDTRTRELVLPKPLGFRFDAGDSLRIRAGSGSSAGSAWRIVAEYEPVAAPQSRIAVLPISAAAAGAGATGGSWEFTSPVAGRVLALAGLTLDGSAEVSLEESATGAALWREVVHAGSGEAFGCPQGIVRAGVMVHAERTYRVLVTGASGGEPAITAYLLPTAVRTVAAGY